jgi:APA family basic amino acid/polyamine antiporter
VPLDQVTSGETFAAQAGEVLFGRAGGLIFSLIVVVSVLGSVAAVVMSAPRVYFAMARDGLFVPFRRCAAQALRNSGARNCAPGRARFCACRGGQLQQIVSYFVFVVVVFIGLSVIALFKFRREDSSGVRYLTPGYPVTPACFW